MPDYDRAWFDPPAPVAYVVVRNPESGAVASDIPMLLDSGADVSLLPANVLEPLGLTAVVGRQYELAGFDRSSSYLSVARVELLFRRRRFAGQFALIDQKWGILGRNILNAVAIVFDGPGLQWDEIGTGRTS
jgi:hypothetical protein